MMTSERLEQAALTTIITAAKVRRDDLRHMATDKNKGAQEAAWIDSAITYVEDRQEARDMAAQDWRNDSPN